MRQVIPVFLKPIIRFFFYKEERRKVFKEIHIRKIQDKNIRKITADAKKLVLFFVQGADYFTGKDSISGGIISIVSLCEESATLKEIHGSEVILATLPGNYLLDKHTKFKNNTDVLRYEQLESYFLAVDNICVHIPEYLVVEFVGMFKARKLNWLKGIKILHVNILNQNIRFMPDPDVIRELTGIVNKVTITTAHQRYCNPHYRKFYSIPLHKFSVWISPEKYFFKEYNAKEDLLVVSPDRHPLKEEILAELKGIEGLKVQIIQDLTYEQYKELISRAKWSLTFGEGLDGYLIEPVFSGAIGFAIYNQEFFTADFAELRTIYQGVQELKERITVDMQALDNVSMYSQYQQQQFKLCAKYYSQAEYKRNLIAFYKSEYTYG